MARTGIFKDSRTSVSVRQVGQIFRTSRARLSRLPEGIFSQILKEAKEYPLSTKESEEMPQSFNVEKAAFRSGTRVLWKGS